MTADAAARAIREADAQGSIGIISSDPHPPYNRPPLSKGLWKGDDPAKTVWRGTETIGVDLRLGRRVTAINRKQHFLREAPPCDGGHTAPAGAPDRPDHLLPDVR